MNFVPSRTEANVNTKHFTMFELLPERNILKLSEDRISEIANLAECIKTYFLNTRSSYFCDNHSLRDYFIASLRLFNSIDSENLFKFGPYNFQFQNKDEFGLVIMFICDKELKYFTEYQQALHTFKTPNDANQQMMKIFGFYSRKLYSIEMHYSLLIKKHFEEKNNKLNRIRKEKK